MNRVLVTGGGSGIGAATAELLADRGATVCVLDRDAEAAERVAARLACHFVAADVADGPAMEAAVAAASERMGGLTGLFNNAGVGNLKPLHAYTDREFDLVVRVNLHGTFHGMRAALPAMVGSGGGAIVNMASVSGVRPTRGEGPYSAAKAGVIALTMAAALEYAPAVRVNCVSPGFVRTPLNELLAADAASRRELEALTPAGRLGEAQEVAEVVAFLLSDAASYVTGQNVVIDGGASLPSAQVDGVLRRLLDSLP